MHCLCFKYARGKEMGFIRTASSESVYRYIDSHHDSAPLSIPVQLQALNSILSLFIRCHDRDSTVCFPFTLAARLGSDTD